MQTTTYSPKSWGVVLSATLFFFYSFIQMTLFSTQEMKSHFTETLSIADPGQFGMFAGMFLIACVIFLLPAGILLDKFSVKKLILISILLVFAGNLGLTYTTNLQAAIVFRFITGAAHGIAFMAPLRLAPRWFPSSKLALASGIIVTIAVSGGLVSQTPMFWLISSFGGKTAMTLNTALGLLIFALVFLFTKDYPDSYDPETKSTTSSLPFWKGLTRVIKNSQNWFAGIYIGLLNLAVLLLGAIWGTNYLMIKYPDLSNEIITSVIGMIFIGTMIGSPLCGWISDKIQNRKWTMIVGASISLLIILLIILVSDLPMILLYIFFLLLGIITAAQTIGYPVIAESNEEKVIGTANGFGAVLVMGMAAIAQPLFGALLNMFGGETPESYAKAIWLMPVSFAIALLCAILLKETFKKSS
jgi:MFS family permease